MGMGIQELSDWVASIQQDYEGEPRSWQDISMPLHEYQFASRLFDKAKKESKGGAYCKWKLETGYTDNFAVVGLYHKDSSDRKDVLTEGEMKWAMTTCNYHYDLDEDVFRQGTREIVDYVRLREDGLMKSFFAGMEDKMFGPGPTSSTQKPYPPASLLWWITATDDSTTENNSEEGWDGYEPVGFGSVGVGGVSCTTYPQWRNRTYPYTTVDDEDFVKKTVRSIELCRFKPPIPRPNIVNEEAPQFEILTTYSRIEAYRDLLKANNDDIGMDMGRYAQSDGAVIRRVPMVWVDAWSNSSSNNVRTDGVVLGVNWKTFKWIYNDGRNMRKHKPYQHPEMSNVRVRKMDDAGQIVCFDRRCNFRGYSTVAVTESTGV